MVFKNIYTVGMEDIGFSNKATNKALIGMMEDAGSLHSASIGYGLKDIETTKRGWVILDWKVKVIRRPDYNEKIEVSTWASNMDKVCAYRDFELRDEKDEIIAIGSSRWILMDIEGRRPARLTSQLGELFKIEEGHYAFSEEESTLKDMTKLDDYLGTANSRECYSYKVERRDIDVNQHMHNLNYLDIAYEVLPEEIYNKGECNHIRITYKKEITYGDIVECEYYFIEQKHHIAMLVNGKVHSVIELF